MYWQYPVVLVYITIYCIGDDGNKGNAFSFVMPELITLEKLSIWAWGNLTWDGFSGDNLWWEGVLGGIFLGGRGIDFRNICNNACKTVGF